MVTLEAIRAVRALAGIAMVEDDQADPMVVGKKEILVWLASMFAGAWGARFGSASEKDELYGEIEMRKLELDFSSVRIA